MNRLQRTSLKAFLHARFELHRGGAHYLQAMEGLRGVAVLLVFLVHYTTMVEPWIWQARVLRVSNALHRVGDLGVEMFFVLSGYLIYASLIARAQPFWPYLRRRIVRIYPAFLAVFVLYVALSLLLPGNNKIPADPGAAAVYLLQNLLLLPGLAPIEPLIAVAWSLSYEMLFYLVVPLLVAALQLRRWHRRARLVLFGVGATAMAVWCAWVDGPMPLVYFMAGMLVRDALAGNATGPGGDARAGRSAVALAAFALAAAATLVPVRSSMAYLVSTGLQFIALAIFFHAVLFGGPGPLQRLLCWQPLRWLGNMSYAYYLLHGLAMKVAFAALSMLVPPQSVPGDLLFLAWLPVVFASTLPPAALLYLLVERPLSLRAAPGRRSPGPASGAQAR